MSNRTVTKDPFTPGERKAWDLICDAMLAVQSLDDRGRLKYNIEPLAEAVHVMQDFVKQHLLHRLYPDEFSDWYEQPKADG